MLKGQEGWEFCSGPLPFSEGVSALGTGLVPSPIKGRRGQGASKLGSCASFLPNPFNDGKRFSKDFCHPEMGGFPKLREDGTSSQSPRQAWRGEQSGVQGRTLFGRPGGPAGFCLFG